MKGNLPIQTVDFAVPTFVSIQLRELFRFVRNVRFGIFNVFK